MSGVKQVQVTFDCAEPERLARFWCDVLGYVVPPPPARFASWDDYEDALPPERRGSAFACEDPDGTGSAHKKRHTPLHGVASDDRRPSALRPWRPVRRLAIAATSTTVPSFLQGRVARDQPLPRVALVPLAAGQNDDEKTHKFRAMLQCNNKRRKAE